MPTTIVRIPTADGSCDALVAYPDDGRQHPAVVMYMDIFGVRPVLQDLAEELAGHGYYVVVPNVFYRNGAAPVVALPEFIGGDARQALVGQLMPIRKGFTTEQMDSDIDAYVQYAISRPEVLPEPIGTVGYCMGAVLAMRTAAAHPDVVAAVGGFHPGQLVTDAADSTHHVIPQMRAAVHLGFAEGDITPENLAVLEEALTTAAGPYSVATYADSQHGYTMADTAAFSADARQRHWDELLQLFRGAL